MKTGIIFDLDGTLLDTLEDLADSVNYILRENGCPERSLGEVRAMVGNGVRMLIARALGEDADDAQTDAALSDFRAAYSGHMDVFTREYEGVTPMLRRLKAAGMRLCVCSNKYNAAVQQLIAAHFPGLFDAVIGEGEGIPRKPDPAGVRLVMQQADADPARTCYIGDSDVDIHTARNAGLHCIAVSWGFADRDALVGMQPDMLCDTMEALENAILAD